jgi:transcriptional regulator with XRE-family HTH domain
VDGIIIELQGSGVDTPQTSRAAVRFPGRRRPFTGGADKREKIVPAHSAGMRYPRVASLFRSVRRDRGLRQIDLASLAHVSQQTVSRIERAELGRLQFCTVDAVADALGIVLDLAANWRGTRGDRLLDRAHAALVDVAAKDLAEADRQTAIEFSFNHYGELLAPNARNRTVGPGTCLFLHQMHVSDWRRVCR